MADERLAAPVLSDEGEHAVLDAVSLAGAGRQMADTDRDGKFVGQDLQFALPKAHPSAVAAAAICGNQQPPGGRRRKGVALATVTIVPRPVKSTGYFTLDQPRIPDLWRVSDAVARLRTLLALHPEGGDIAGFFPEGPAAGPAQALKAGAIVSSSLLAGLGLAREGEAVLHQAQSFGVISVAAAAAFQGETGVNCTA